MNGLTRWPRILLSAIMVLLAVLILTQTGCVRIPFYKTKKDMVGSPNDIGLEYDQVEFASGDGTRLKGWFVRSATPSTIAVLHYHGNNENVAGSIHSVGWLAQQGMNVFVFDYRGFGQSEGTPTKEGLHLDAVAALQYVCALTNVTDVKVWGQSLGGTLALAAVAEIKPTKVKAVAIESTFYSYQSIVRDVMWKVRDVGAMALSYVVVANEESAYETIAKLSPVPLLLVHGRNDKVVDFSHAEKLYQAAREPKTALWTDCGHSDCIGTNLVNRARLVEFFRSGT